MLGGAALTTRIDVTEKPRDGLLEEVLEDGPGVPIRQALQFAGHPPVEGTASDSDACKTAVPGLLGQFPSRSGEVGAERLDRGPALLLDQLTEQRHPHHVHRVPIRMFLGQPCCRPEKEGETDRGHRGTLRTTRQR
ncbi:hypothetical protein ABZ599_16075 [Streptomyces misionensis]|uniref:hypothetical protein n=1 Tax=Streptomyces misionensis TaxID=67331 RepID=UPI0033CB945C